MQKFGNVVRRVILVLQGDHTGHSGPVSGVMPVEEAASQGEKCDWHVPQDAPHDAGRPAGWDAPICGRTMPPVSYGRAAGAPAIFENDETLVIPIRSPQIKPGKPCV